MASRLALALALLISAAADAADLRQRGEFCFHFGLICDCRTRICEGRDFPAPIIRKHHQRKRR